MNLRQAAHQALEALEGLADYRYTDRVKNTMTALRAALAEPEQNPFGDDAERYARKLHEEREYYKVLFTEKPSGSFVLWENTLCNPLSDPRSMAHSAWHDGYASGVKAEREACAKVCDDWPNGRDDVDSIAAAIRSRT